MRATRFSVWACSVYFRSCGVSDLPKPMWSGTTTRWCSDSGPIMFRYR